MVTGAGGERGFGRAIAKRLAGTSRRRPDLVSSSRMPPRHRNLREAGAREGRVWPDADIRTAWDNAVIQAKLDDFHFHYAHLAPEHLRNEIAKTERRRQPADASTQGSTQEPIDLLGALQTFS